MLDIDTTKLSPDLRKTLVWFSTAYRRLKKHEHVKLEQGPGRTIYHVEEAVPRYVDVDYITARDALIRFQNEWSVLATLDLPKRGDEVQARMSATTALDDEIGAALDAVAKEAKILEKDLSDLGAKIANEK
jgi:hypothetical protein